MILHLKILIKLLLGLNLIFLAGIFFYKGMSLDLFLSFEFGFIAQVLIVFFSFINYKKFISLSAKNFKFQKRPLQIFAKKNIFLPTIIKFFNIEDDFKPKFSFLAKNALVFFSFFKILAYLFLILGFMVLNYQGLLSIFALFCAMFVMPLAVLIYNFLIRKC